jgi:hypothetical protein
LNSIRLGGAPSGRDGLALDRVDPCERRELVVVLVAADRACDPVPPPQVEAAHERLGHVHVPVSRQVAGHAQEPVALGQQVEHALADLGVVEVLLLTALALTGTAALATTVPLAAVAMLVVPLLLAALASALAATAAVVVTAVTALPAVARLAGGGAVTGLARRCAATALAAVPGLALIVPALVVARSHTGALTGPRLLVAVTGVAPAGLGDLPGRPLGVIAQVLGSARVVAVSVTVPVVATPTRTQALRVVGTVAVGLTRSLVRLARRAGGRVGRREGLEDAVARAALVDDHVDQVGLAHPLVAGELQRRGDGAQLCERLLLEHASIHVLLRVSGVGDDPCRRQSVGPDC